PEAGIRGGESNRTESVGRCVGVQSLVYVRPAESELMAAPDGTDVFGERAHSRVTNAGSYLTADARISTTDPWSICDAEVGKFRGKRMRVPILHTEARPCHGVVVERLHVCRAK